MHPSPASMHIPDGFLSTLVALFLWGLSVLSIAIALRRVGRDLGERQVPLMGVLAAGIFAGQMLNFPVAGGTSGHLLGAALSTALLGPWQALIVMTSVVSLQALIFQDGGLLALGGNLFNMAVIGVAVSHFVLASLRKLARGKPWGLFAGGALAGWASIFLAALACALELSASGTAPANLTLPAMGGIHLLIGLGEAAITVGAISFIFKARPDLFQQAESPAQSSRGLWAAGLLIAVLLVILSPLASAHPDGLEWVAEQKGFLESARAPLFNLIPDYVLPGIQNSTLATILAGLIGVLLVFAATVGVAVLRRGRKPARSKD